MTEHWTREIRDQSTWEGFKLWADYPVKVDNLYDKWRTWLNLTEEEREAWCALAALHGPERT